MSKHAKNNCARHFFTAAERARLDYWTKKRRLGAGSVKDFDACCICLAVAVRPMACPKGHLFCKECIYELLLNQKQEIQRQLQMYNEQQTMFQRKKLGEGDEAREAEIRAFERAESSLLPADVPIGRSEAAGPPPAAPRGYKVDAEQREMEEKAARVAELAGLEAEKRATGLTHNFWLPDQTPSAVADVIPKPSGDTMCTEGDHKLKLKQLVNIIFDEEPDTSKGRYRCPTCKKTLSNAKKSAFLIKCGHAFCLDCARKFLKMERQCTVCQSPLAQEREVVPLQTGGTGFAGHGASVEARVKGVGFI